MDFMLISYGDEKYDGRLRELIKVFKSLGQLTTFSMNDTQMSNHAKFKYLSFIRAAVAFSKAKSNIDVLVLDNRKAILPGLFVMKKVNPKKVILDCRELYFMNEVHTIQGKLGCLLEKYLIPKADVVICANRERASIMSEEYRLRRKPLVFENIRKLMYSNNFDSDVLKVKYKDISNGDSFNIISTAGCNLTQATDVLVKNINRVERNVRLLLVGNCESKDEEVIRTIIKNNNLTNVYILGKVAQDELKYLLSLSDVGIVSYSQEGRNNKYCASGKVFEYINEGLPIVTTTNPPLKNLCDTESIGIADDTFADGINRILANYDFYREKVTAFAKNRTVENNNDNLARNIEDIIQSNDAKKIGLN